MNVVVVGAGISGLTAAVRLLEGREPDGRPLEVTVLEAQDRAGGHAWTHEGDGFRVEAGPGGFLDREPALNELIARLGIESRVITARPEARHRFVFHRGRLRRVPDSPTALLRSDALSVAGRLRVMLEPWSRAAPPGTEESVHAFATRRIGREAAEALVAPAVSGISAGDSRALSVAAAFPAMVEMEREHGSLIRAMVKRRGQRPALASFDGGMGTLIKAMRMRLGRALRTGSAVRELARADGAWRLGLESGEAVVADRVLLAVPAHRAAAIVTSLDPELARILSTIPFAGLAVVGLAYRAADLGPLQGYGVLVGTDAGRDTLGVVWESSVFEHRAEPDTALLRVMLGGSRRPEVVELPENELIERARCDLDHVMGVKAKPLRSWVWRWPRSIAQYAIGHLDRVAAARARVATHPGLELLGTSYDGISFTSGARSGHDAAERVLAALRREAETPGPGRANTKGATATPVGSAGAPGGAAQRARNL